MIATRGGEICDVPFFFTQLTLVSGVLGARLMEVKNHIMPIISGIQFMVASSYAYHGLTMANQVNDDTGIVSEWAENLKWQSSLGKGGQAECKRGFLIILGWWSVIIQPDLWIYDICTIGCLANGPNVSKCE